MAELLLEILSEEIPARMQEKAGKDLGRMLEGALKKAGLSVTDAEVYTGPRRLVFTADVPNRSPDVKEERKGPRVGSPPQALAGFMRGAGLDDISQAETRSDKKGEHYVAVLEKAGRAASAIIGEALPEIMGKFPWPKSMKSGTSTFRWVRPIKSILCILDGDVVPFTVNDIAAGNVTAGHRRMGKGPFTVKSFKDYKKTLETKGHVIIDACERKAIILKDAKAACAKAGLELVEDEGLLSEVAGLAEWPVVILGDMDESFLKLPGEVIRLSMRTHQKYFAVRDPKTGELAPNFIVVANQVAPDGGKQIALGNSRVLSARLDDARFFEAEDAKRTLESRFDDLDGVVFHQKLGTIKDKSERVAALARELAPKVGADPDKAYQAARLAKCDLVTNMVVEFTSLQGQIGRLMYEKEGGDKDIAIAIEEHYKPQGPSDKVPTNPVAVAVALADKLDTLVGFWAIDEKPTGSKDPFALRRAALGVVRIILENGVNLNLYKTISEVCYASIKSFDGDDFRHRVEDLFNAHSSDNTERKLLELEKFGTLISLIQIRTKYLELMRSIADGTNDNACWLDCIELIYYFPLELLGDDVSHFLPIGQKYSDEQTNKSLIKERQQEFDKALEGNVKVVSNWVNPLQYFILDRLKGHLRDDGVHHTHIDAVFALGGDDLVDITNRVHALGSFLSTDEGANLLAGYKRASNILKAEEKKGALPSVEISKGTAPEEGVLFGAIKAAKPLVAAALESEDYAGAMSALASLRAPIDGFFDKVIVNSDVASERENRLGLLIEIRTLAKTIADFDKIEG